MVCLSSNRSCNGRQTSGPHRENVMLSGGGRQREGKRGEGGRKGEEKQGKGIKELLI